MTTYDEVLVDEVISILDGLQMVLKALLALLKHILLKLQVVQVSIFLLLFLEGALDIFLVNLALDGLKLHTLVLLLDLFLYLRPETVDFAILFQMLNRLNFGFVIHDVALLFGNVGSC